MKSVGALACFLTELKALENSNFYPLPSEVICPEGWDRGKVSGVYRPLLQRNSPLKFKFLLRAIEGF